jgi:hypothetical protein
VRPKPVSRDNLIALAAGLVITVLVLWIFFHP